MPARVLEPCRRGFLPWLSRSPFDESRREAKERVNGAAVNESIVAVRVRHNAPLPLLPVETVMIDGRAPAQISIDYTALGALVFPDVESAAVAAAGPPGDQAFDARVDSGGERQATAPRGRRGAWHSRVAGAGAPHAGAWRPISGEGIQGKRKRTPTVLALN